MSHPVGETGLGEPSQVHHDLEQFVEGEVAQRSPQRRRQGRHQQEDIFFVAGDLCPVVFHGLFSLAELPVPSGRPGRCALLLSV